MDRSAGNRLLELRVGPFHLAVRSRHVVAAEEGHLIGGPLSPPDPNQYRLRRELVTFRDLQPALGGPPRYDIPFVVTVEAGGTRMALGVDAIGRLYDLEGQTTAVALPTFGLTDPALFEGAVRAENGLLLVLQPQKIMARLAAQISPLI